MRIDLNVVMCSRQGICTYSIVLAIIVKTAVLREAKYFFVCCKILPCEILAILCITTVWYNDIHINQYI